MTYKQRTLQRMLIHAATMIWERSTQFPPLSINENAALYQAWEILRDAGTALGVTSYQWRWHAERCARCREIRQEEKR